MSSNRIDILEQLKLKKTEVGLSYYVYGLDFLLEELRGIVEPLRNGMTPISGLKMKRKLSIFGFYKERISDG